MDPKEYKGTMPACFEKGLPRCPAEAVIPTMTVETDEGIKKLSNTVVHVVQNNATYYVDDKHRITEICTEPVERNDYDFDNNPEGFRGQIVFDYATNRAAYFNNAGQSFSLVTDNIDFNALSNRPKYNGVQMTSSTNIPLVPTRVSELANDAHYQTESDVQTTVSNAVATHNTSPTAHNDIRQALADEVSARTAGVKKVADDLADEITARTNADTALEAADTALGNRITAETTNRTNADTALGTRITNETTARQNADSALQGDITAEENARKAADKTLQDNIDAEANTRSLADTTLQSNITAEATARGNADTALGTRITDETTNRTDADTALGGRIDTEVTNRTNADTALGGRIDTEITNRTNADTAIENKLDRTVLYDLEMETDANNVTFVEDKVNLKTGGTSTERDVIPAASRTTAGTISASEYISLVDAEEKITALLEGAVAIDNLPANPTQQQLTDAWLAATGKDELINRASIYDSANQLVHTYYTNVSEWEDSPAGGQITIDQFTNSAAGIIKGSTTDGNVSANLDGTGTVSGWTALKNTVAGKQDTLTAGNNISISGSTISATDTTYSAGTGLSLTGTTFAVDTTTIAQKSDIPTVNNATLTIQKNGTDVQTFTANSASNKTANITVPTKTSELTNDSNFPVDANYVHTDNNFTTTLKNKLDGIAAGAEVNQNAFSTVKVGSTNVAADSKTDTLELVAGSNVTLTPDATNDKVTIAATDTTYSDATTSTAGLMSAADKTKLNGIATGAEVNQNAFSNVKVGNTTVAADSKTDTLELATDGSVTLTPDATNDKVTISVPTATTSVNGLMSAADKTKLNGIASGAEVNVQSDWSVTDTSSDAFIKNKPTIPTVNNATLTIQKNGTTVQTFTANSSTNKTANITVPTKVTDLTDATNYVAKDGDFYVTGEGSNFSMTGTSQNVYADLRVKGDTQQTTYTGKNLFKVQATSDVTPGATYTKLSDTSFSIAATGQQWARAWIALPNNLAQNTSYAIKFNYSASPDVSFIRVTGRTSSSEVFSRDMTSGAEATVSTGANDVSVIAFYISTNNSYTGTVTISDFQIETGSSATSFEPYVGGTASPNPDYPQEVEVVTGRQVIRSMGKNLLGDHLTGSINWSGTRVDYYGDEIKISKTGGGGISANPHTAAQYTPLKQGNTYTFSAKYNRGTIVLNGSYSWVFYVYGVYPDGTTSGTADSRWQVIIPRTSTTPDRASVTFTPTKDFIGFKLGCYIAVDTPNTTGDVYFDCQLEKASAVTPFEPYLGKEIEVNLGKNLFDKSTVTNGYRLGSDGLPYADTPFSVSDYIPIQGNATYTYSRKLTTGDQTVTAICYYDASKTFISRTMPMITNHTASGQVTPPANAVYARIADRTEGLNAYQFEKGSAATTYAPYFTPIELCKIGAYQDHLYPSGGKWYLHKTIGHDTRDVEINGIANDNTATPTNVSQSGTFDFGNWNWTPDYATTAGNAILSSNIGVYKLDANVTGNSGARAMESGTFCQRQGTDDRVYFRNTGYAGKTGNEVRATLLANSGGVNLWWYLSTPTDTEITNPLLVAQLDDLWRNLQSGTNTTNVNVEGDLPAILGVTAFTNTLASAMAGINERMNRLPAIPQITMTTTDPGEGQTLADNHFIAVYNN